MGYQSLDEDRKLILAAADELTQYLSSSVVLWPLRGIKQPLSPGNLLFSRARLAACSIDPALVHTLSRIEEIINAKRSVWVGRVEKEIPLRLNQYRVFVEDYTDLGAIDAGYRHNISVRVKLDLLFAELQLESAVDRKKITELDRKLHSLVIEGDFIWENELRTSFPLDKFGYLYITGK